MEALATELRLLREARSQTVAAEKPDPK